jgi:hypothetical protein
LPSTKDMYCRGLDLIVVGGFDNHEGFDGVMLGTSDASYHFEFTRHRSHPVAPAPTTEDLVVFYIPSSTEWHATCGKMSMAGFELVRSFNPYWDSLGRTYQDRDGYRIVLHNAEWMNVASSWETGECIKESGN